EYANDPRMRLNLGIRRRLAPLMENDRRRVELLNSILFTMPGSPIVYYGDELAMGDNIYLGDRDGVRTPMQWSPDRNGGFSRAETARLYLPAIVDSQYGFQSINVEAQQQSPFSLLNWMRRLIQVRKQHRAFGRGGIRFLRPENPHILAYLREYEGDDILLVHNLSGSAQAVRLDLAEFAGARPVELLGGTEFLPVDETPYALTLSPYGFFWFSLRRGVGTAAGPLDVAGLVAAMPRQWLRQQRWFRSKARGITELELWDRAPLGEEQGELSVLTVLLVEYSDAPPERYLLPLLARRGEAGASGAEPIAIASGEGSDVRLFDGAADARTGALLLEAIAEDRELPSRRGRFVGRRTDRFPSGPLPEVRRMTLEQSNTSIVFGEALILKIFRVLEAGVNPELELPLYLAEETDFGAIPPVAGWIDYEVGGRSAPGAVLTTWVANRGDGWSHTLERLEAFFGALPVGVEGAEEPTGVGVEERADGYLDEVELLGDTIARLHLALASAPRDRADLAPEPLTSDDVAHWTRAAHAQVTAVLGEVAARIESIPGAVAPALLPHLDAAVRAEPHAKLLLNGMQRLEEGGTVKTRLHGDLHLGQLLRAAGHPRADTEPWYVIDFEGEPIRSLAERRAKNTPLRDVAGMLRSFSYAACTAETAWRQTHPDADVERIRRWAGAWEREVRERFLTAYLERTDHAPFLPSDPAAVREVLAALELDKAVYELGYELNNRPEWLWIPLRALPKNAA
ncbi:MAG: alpha-glucosidase C-terminal domain-containing protein, partial [Longimicrobiaceae bacterium]